MSIVTNVELDPHIGATSWLRICKSFDVKTKRWMFAISFYDGDPDSGGATVALGGKRRVHLAFRDVDECTITQEIIARLNLRLKGDVLFVILSFFLKFQRTSIFSNSGTDSAHATANENSLTSAKVGVACDEAAALLLSSAPPQAASSDASQLEEEIPALDFLSDSESDFEDDHLSGNHEHFKNAFR
jgi:hypothetical protein